MDLFLIVLPVFLIFFAGWLGQKLIGFDIKSISKVALYLMSPFLAFRTFYTNEVTMDYIYIFLFCCLLSFILIVVTWITGLIMRADRPKLSAMILGGAFMNSGNYGAPVVLFALGVVAFDYAVIMMVFQSFLMNSIGILVASIGGKENASIRDAVMQVVKMPVIYGAILGLALQLLSIHLPDTLMNAVELVADASIPTVMLVLGMQLAAIQRKRVAYRYVSATVGIRMIVSPLLALLILYFLPMNDLIKAVLFIQASMPAAANTTLLAIQFDTEPDLVSFTTFITTIVSLLTIPYVLFLVGV
ncbi:AEC family transporter [Bacillus norwichensis]|uniref:AEC family transporter n=1 Tax=Bacillus norwichensis TaxID=2762217 RepID=A0ABR8VQX0_9BACI|nr:AEC family transporter [Bacillus norwichensis]MBD8007174.1 AEC family transporter [Bacillus norwichensis]